MNLLKVNCYVRIKKFFFDNPYAEPYVSDYSNNFDPTKRSLVGSAHYKLEFDTVWSIWYAYTEWYTAQAPSLRKDIFSQHSRFRLLFSSKNFLNLLLGKAFGSLDSRAPLFYRFKAGVHFSKKIMGLIRIELRLMLRNLKPSTYPHIHAIDNAVQRVDKYLDYRYPGGRARISTYGAVQSFYINIKNVHPSVTSKIFRDRLDEAILLGGHFVFSPGAYQKNHPNDYHRVSEFYKRLKVGNKQVNLDKKRSFITSRLTNSFNDIINRKILNINSMSKGVPQPIIDLLKLTKGFAGSDPERMRLGLRWPSHDAIQREVRIKLKNYFVGTEIPVWRKHVTKLVTGHIDIALIIGDTLFICDYKPDGTGDPNTPTLSSSFIESIPQVAGYVRILKSDYAIKKVFCVTFNHKGEGWIFHDSLLTDLETWMTNMGISHEIIWQGFI